MNTEKNFSPCDNFDADLKAYVDGELSLWQRLRMRTHLAQCTQCREEMKLMETLTKEVNSEELAPLDADLRSKILQDAPVDIYGGQETSISAPPKRKTRTAMEYGFALAGLLIVAVVFQSVTGNRIKNTFNSAANAITTGDDYFADTPSRAPSAAGSSAGSPSDYAQPSEKTLKRAFPAGQLQQQIDRMQAPSAASPMLPTAPERSVHKEGNLTVVVDNAEARGSSVETIVKNAGGFIANNALSTGSGGIKTATLDLRVPVDEFETIVSKIGALGTVKAKNITGEDVTTKVAVSGARRDTLSHQLAIAQAQLRQLQKQRKPDVYEVAQARATVRSLSLSAAQAKAEETTLKRFAALSNLYVTLQDKSKPVAPASFSGSLGQTGRDAWNSFLSSARYPIQALIWILAYAPLWIPALIIWRRWGRKAVLGQ